MTAVQRMSIYGDSIMKGIVLDKSTNRYCVSDENIGIREIERKYSLSVKSNTVFGCTAEKGFSRMKKHFDRDVDCDVALIEYGGNDSDFKWGEVADSPESEHLPNTPLDRFRQIYLSMISYVKSKGIVPVLSTLPPVCSAKYLDWICRDGLSRLNILKWLTEVDVIGSFQKQYSDMIARIAAETGCACVDLRAAFTQSGDYSSLFCDDGIHPNHDGQRVINGCLCNALNTVLA